MPQPTAHPTPLRQPIMTEQYSRSAHHYLGDYDQRPMGCRHPKGEAFLQRLILPEPELKYMGGNGVIELQVIDGCVDTALCRHVPMTMNNRAGKFDMGRNFFRVVITDQDD